MPTPEILRALLGRVSAAMGPARELDLAIYDALCPDQLDPAMFWLTARGYTVSLDAARALIDRVLPGWSRESGHSGFGPPAWCRLWDPMKAPGPGRDTRVDHASGSEPLAILAALLTALSEGAGDAR